jgi:serine/threonine protein phosphatase 1
MVDFTSARTPDDIRLYAIGDIHGCLEDLRDVHADIAEDIRRNPVDDWRIIHLGDFIDRGPDNSGVLDFMIECSADPRVLSVRGNHDQYLLDFMANPQTGNFTNWINYGGQETLRDYQIDYTIHEDATPGERARLHADLVNRIPRAHLDFLRALPLTLSFGDYLFVHAGIRPGVAMEDQTARDLTFIRVPFLEWDEPLDHVVVHGHTPTSLIEIRRHRIGIDTSCVFGGLLSCIVLEGNDKSRLVGRWREILEL